MTYILFFLSLGLSTSLILSFQRLQKIKNENLITQQHLQEADKRANENFIKTQQRLQEANKRVRETEQKYGEIISREDKIKALDFEISDLTHRLQQLNAHSEERKREVSLEISSLEKKLSELEEQDFLADFGFYESKYDFQEVKEYKHQLDEIRSQQKKMLKDKRAAVCHSQWTVEGSTRKGRKMTNDFLKLVLRAFNGECDTAVVKARYNNIHVMESRIEKAYSALNKLSETTHCEITFEFLDLKLQELYLTHEYQERKHQEKEEQRLIREQMREEERALRELEKAREEAEKEERRYQEALEEARQDIAQATGKAQEKLSRKIEELQKRLTEAEANKERAVSQAQMTKSGHVYIISNIGSFGEGIYKIGMTRRLDPMERVKELSGASVPFAFDVHAMVSSSNAPELETCLHKRFEHRRLNRINKRKEFFEISLEEIVKAVQDIDEELGICKSDVKITKVAEAAEYRKSAAKERQLI